MLGIIFLVLIALAIHKFGGDLSNFKDAYKTALETAATLAQVNPTSPNARRAKMEAAFGTPWATWNPEASPDAKFNRPATKNNFLRRYFGPMEMEVAGDQVLIYDMQLGNVDFTHDDELSLFQTVISIKPPELRLPPFVLRPKCIFSDGYLEGNLIQTNTALDTQFTLETLTPHRVRALFQSELGNEVLIPLLNDRKWTVQWTGKWLIVYEMNRLIDPERLAEAALEVSEFFELLKSGPAAVDQGINDLIQQTIQHTNDNSAIGLKRPVH